MVAVLLCAFAQAQAEILEQQRHRDWMSFILTTPDGGIARMTTMDGATMLAIDILPGNKYSIKLLEYVSDEERRDYAFADRLRMPGKMRVDRKSTYDVVFRFYLDENALVGSLSGAFHERLLEEARKGSVLRMMIGTEDPLYVRFSLMGFSAALERCERLSQILEQVAPPDSDYFDEPSPAPRGFHNGRRDDGAFFL